MKISLCGSHGTGKTTLINHEYFKDNFPDHKMLGSVSRKYDHNLSSKRLQTSINNDYLRTHYWNDKFISPRSFFDGWAYSRITCGLTFFFQRFNLGVRAIKYDYLFYVPIEIDEIEDDGFRPLDKDYQIVIDKEIKLLLDFYHIPYHTISGTTEERITKISNIISL